MTENKDLYGKRFDPPYVSAKMHPGSWINLGYDTPLTLRSIEYLLHHISHSLNFRLGDNLEIDIKRANSQIVNGINLYIEFNIIKNDNTRLDVQTLIHIKSISETSIPNIIIKNIFIHKI